MKIDRLKTNHLVDPLGFDLGDEPVLSFVISEAQGKHLKEAKIRVTADPEGKILLCEEAVIDPKAHKLSFALCPRTRYYWSAWAMDETGDQAVSETAWFETPKGKEEPWKAEWIRTEDKEVHPIFYKKLGINGKVAKARIYMLGLGVYELYLGGEKIGDECLMPGLHTYDHWLQYQTYDVTDALNRSDDMEVLVGNGWYKGIFGLDYTKESYGDQFALLAEIHVEYEDGRIEVIGTDTSWQARSSFVMESGIYYGEVQDHTAEVHELAVMPCDIGYEKLSPRLSPALRIQKTLKPVEVIHTPKGETVLDMGQNMVGWIQVDTELAKGQTMTLKTGEILQEGCFYQDNLRRAKSLFVYTSDGQKRTVRQHFTFYGFRYVLVEGLDTVDPEAFTGCVIHSDMEETGWIETSDPLVNRLFENVIWGQRGNFLDVPTDCPQRDERMGWTGDAQIFSGTASFNMDTYAFYRKYGKDLAYEQSVMGGSVPYVVPMVGTLQGGSTGWGEAATVIPWEVYLHFGDDTILKEQYDSMKAWVDYMEARDKASGTPGLWDNSTHFGDWLALDGPVEGGVYGATDVHFIATAYYCHSTRILSKAAGVLGKKEDEAYYKALAEKVNEALLKEYLTPGGRLAIPTQTAHVMLLFLDLVPEDKKPRLAHDLMMLLKDSNNHLKTGFVGTPYLCRALSDHGYNELAYKLLMVKDFPGWLYEVLMGATTVWERWNSVLPDGRISGTEMNSLNHYSYGSIAEWLYRNAAGIRPVETAPGFKKIILAPQPSYQLTKVKAGVQSASGYVESGWELTEDGKQVTVRVEVPFDTTAEIRLPDADAAMLGSGFSQQGAAAVTTVEAGRYEWTYTLTRPYKAQLSVYSKVEEILANEQAKAILDEAVPGAMRAAFAKELPTLDGLLKSPFLDLPPGVLEAIDEKLRKL